MKVPDGAIIGYTMNRTGTITGGGIRVDTADATRAYRMAIYVNGVFATSIALAVSTVSAFSTSLSVAVVAGDHVTAFMERTSGGGASTFGAISGWLEVTVS